jgi:hypothetical protein
MPRGRSLLSEAKPKSLGAEETLLLAVLEQAVADLDHECPAVRADAEAYIFTYASDYTVFSFDSVCSYFKLSPEAVRRSLRARHVRKSRAKVSRYRVAA